MVYEFTKSTKVSYLFSVIIELHIFFFLPGLQLWILGCHLFSFLETKQEQCL